MLRLWVTQLPCHFKDGFEFHAYISVTRNIGHGSSQHRFQLSEGSQLVRSSICQLGLELDCYTNFDIHYLSGKQYSIY